MIEKRIYLIRGQKVLLDSDLADLYGVSTKRLNEQVKRNKQRFPKDFMFHLTSEENENLKSQFATSSPEHGGRRTTPYAFTEHGAVMLAAVLNSSIAIEASIRVVRAFVKLRSILTVHKELAKKIDSLEYKTDAQFKIVFDLIKSYLKPASDNTQKQIGFDTKR